VKETITKSDLTGEIVNGHGVTVTIKAGQTTYVLDANENEVEDLILKGRKTKTRGRPRKTLLPA